MGVMRYLSLLIAACLLSGAGESAAQSVPLTAEQQTFVQRYVDAVRAKDTGRLKALVHPKSLACIRSDSASFFDDVFASRIRDQVEIQYQASAQPVPPGRPLLMEGDVTYPVRPTHWIQIDLAPGATAERILMVQVVAEGGGTWLEVLPCPTPETLAKYRAAKAAASTQDQRARELVTNLKDPLRSELRQLLRDGRKVSAIMRYSQEVGEDPSVARRVIELLGEQGN